MRRQHVDAVIPRRSAISAADRSPCCCTRSKIRKSLRSSSTCIGCLTCGSAVQRILHYYPIKGNFCDECCSRGGLRFAARAAWDEAMEIYAMREFDGHELVVFGNNAAAGLRAIVAVHSTALGPAAGGCRMWPYD